MQVRACSLNDESCRCAPVIRVKNMSFVLLQCTVRMGIVRGEITNTIDPLLRISNDRFISNASLTLIQFYNAIFTYYFQKKDHNELELNTVQ